MELPEDIYAGGPQNPLLRYWLSIDITREMADESLMSPVLAPAGSFIVRRSISAPGDYAITVSEGKHIKSYKISDLGCGQVGLKTGQAFASLEHLLEFFYDNPFPEPGDGHVPLRIMHQYLVGQQPMAPPQQQFAPQGYPAMMPQPTYDPVVARGHPAVQVMPQPYYQATDDGTYGTQFSMPPPLPSGPRPGQRAPMYPPPMGGQPIYDQSTY